MEVQTNHTPRPGDPVINREHANEVENQELNMPTEQVVTLDHTTEVEPTIDMKKELKEPTLDEPAKGTEIPPEGTPALETQTATGEGEGEITPPTFTPDFKFKVRDEEHEMDDWVKDHVKDEETLKKFQDLYTRGHGLEIAKTERDQFKQEYTDLAESVNKVAQISNQYYSDPANPQHAAKVAREFIEALNLPKQMFLQYAMEEVRVQNLPPEQQQAIAIQRQNEAQAAQLQQQNQQLQEQQGSMQSQHFAQLLEYKMADPTVAPVVQDYETRVGKQGAFREMVVQRGIYHQRINGTVITPDQAVNEVIQLLGIPGGTQTQTGAQAGTLPNQSQQQQPTPAQQQVAQSKKPVLPNMSGQGSASPVKKTYTSLDQIRQRRDQLIAQQNGQ